MENPGVRHCIRKDVGRLAPFREPQVRETGLARQETLFRGGKARAHSQSAVQVPLQTSMTRPLMVVGTASHAGKSIFVTALCRILKQDGLRVAPFKSQNMALNSFVCKDGSEIGRAQVAQAEAAGIEPEADMNPILLKPAGNTQVQVVLHGRVHGTMTAAKYYEQKPFFFKKALESFHRLQAKFDAIVLEGAGSPVGA